MNKRSLIYILVVFNLGVLSACGALARPTSAVQPPTLTPAPTSTLHDTASPSATPVRPAGESAITATMTATVTITLPLVSAAPSAVVVDPVLVGAGDIASCDTAGDEATAQLLTAISGTVFTLGDNVYSSGTADQFSSCYDPSWGQVKARTRPSAGNHDYVTANAAPYFAYFGAAAGEAGKGYYSYEVGAWHVIVLNSNCWAVGGCGANSAQLQWLQADLAAHPAACTLAYWHHPRFSSGPHGNSTDVATFWQALYDAGADVVLNGHDHTYERFDPQTPAGAADPARGIREFVVGSGGYSHYATGAPVANSVVRNSDTYGVLKLTLHATGYDWQFIPVAGMTFSDSGSASCH